MTSPRSQGQGDEAAVTTPASMTEWPGGRFLPPPEPREGTDASKRYEGVTYAAPPGYRPLQLDVWVPAAAAPPPLVVWIHGGVWLFGDRRYLPGTLRPNQLFEELIHAGLAVATIDYRHALEAHFPAQLHDAKAAIRYLRAYADVLGVDTSRIGVWGESAGGHLAALIALTAQRPELEGTLGVLGESSAVDAVVDWYGVADLTLPSAQTPPPENAAQPPSELLTAPYDLLVGGQDDDAYAAASPISYVTPAAPPFLLVHGTADTLVPYLHSEVLAQALTEARVPVRLVPIEGADHIFNGHDDIDGVVRLSVDYLAEALLPARQTQSS
jgi:acetyl esterase/lipase